MTVSNVYVKTSHDEWHRYDYFDIDTMVAYNVYDGCIEDEYYVAMALDFSYDYVFNIEDDFDDRQSR